MKFITILIFIVSLQLNARVFDDSAEKKISSYFDILSYDDTYFEPDGAVCERVANIEVESLYPSANFNIVNGIQYDEKKTTLGELDLVIFDRSTGMVEAIAEVKCWTSFKNGLKKAKEQRARFLNNLNKNIIISDENGNKFSKDLFKNIKKYFTISQFGGLQEGFDFELSLNLKELEELRRRLLFCNAEGKCPQK